MPQSKYVKGSIIMEEKKKHIEIHIDIDKAADRRRKTDRQRAVCVLPQHRKQCRISYRRCHQ